MVDNLLVEVLRGTLPNSSAFVGGERSLPLLFLLSPLRQARIESSAQEIGMQAKVTPELRPSELCSAVPKYHLTSQFSGQPPPDRFRNAHKALNLLDYGPVDGHVIKARQRNVKVYVVWPETVAKPLRKVITRRLVVPTMNEREPRREEGEEFMLVGIEVD
jgi:hypothetical protein